MNCKIVRSQIEAWQLKSLSEDRELDISSHLLECASCRAELALLRQIEKELAHGHKIPPVHKHKPRVLSLASAVGLLLVATFIGARANAWLDPESLSVDTKTDRQVLVAQSVGAEFEFQSEDHIELRVGEIELEVASEQALLVSTRLGSIRATNASFVVSMKEENEMDSRTILSGAGILTVGVIVGAVVFQGEDGEQNRIEAGHEVRVRDSSDKRKQSVSVVPRRVSRDEAMNEELKRQMDLVRELQARLKQTNAQNQSDRELIAKLQAEKKEVVEPKERAIGEGKIEPEDLADLLGLEAAREEALVVAYNRIQEKMRLEEKRHATVEKTESGYRIKIESWRDEWDLMKKNWRRDLGAILLPNEMDRYDRHGMQKSLFFNQGGFGARSVAVTEEKDGFQVQDTVNGDGWKRSTMSNGFKTLEEATQGIAYLLDGE